jgi:hypothetical protein
MYFRTALAAGIAGACLFISLLQAQRPFKEYPAIEYEDFPLPSDWKDQKHEWVRARLRYPDIYGYPDHSFLRMGPGRPWPGQWTMDYPRSDRHLLAGVRRLTRIDTRSVEQVVDLDGTDDVYNWPMMYAVEVGHWLLPQAQANQLREYLLRGGFLMVDDFWGTSEWEVFMQSMRKVLPERQAVELPTDEQIFHTVYDLNDRYQIVGAWGVGGFRPYQNDGDTPYWRGIYDDKGRVVVAIVMNSDTGDSWEYADDPYYPEKYSALGIRVGVNYIVYGMTH